MAYTEPSALTMEIPRRDSHSQGWRAMGMDNTTAYSMDNGTTACRRITSQNAVTSNKGHIMSDKPRCVMKNWKQAIEFYTVTRKPNYCYVVVVEGYITRTRGSACGVNYEPSEGESYWLVHCCISSVSLGYPIKDIEYEKHELPIFYPSATNKGQS